MAYHFHQAEEFIMKKIAVLCIWLLPLTSCSTSSTTTDGGQRDAASDHAISPTKDGASLDAAVGPLSDAPTGPTYLENAQNFKEGPAAVTLEVTINDLMAQATGSAVEPSPTGRIAACSYNFGDDSPPVEVPADSAGVCQAATHLYTEAGGYDVTLAVWDNLGMLSQAKQVVSVGAVPQIGQLNSAKINDCLEAYWWKPQSGGPKFPTMVQYTPYTIDQAGAHSTFIKSGLAVLMVTNQGQGSSCGVSDLFGAAAQNDLLEIDKWLAAQPWANGDYCLWGHSGPGIMGALSASLKPPHLKCAVVGGGDTSFYERLFTKSGAWWPVGAMWVLGTYGEAAMKEPQTRILRLVEYLVAGHEPQRSSVFFDPRDRTAALQQIQIPVLFETSWDDLAWGAGSSGGPYLDLVGQMAHPGSALIIYPGPHASFDPSNERPFRTFPDHRTSFVREMRRFFVHYLKGGSAPATTGYNYLYFQLKGGVQAALMNRQYGGWKTSLSWPSTETSPVSLYLREESSGTVTSRHDGSLALAAPADKDLAPFAYKPAPFWDPVYSSGSAPWRSYTFPDMRALDIAGVTFTSPPLVADAEVQGPVQLELTAESELFDFDWMAVLEDVWPDGSSHRVSSGFLRASLRDDLGTYKPKPQGLLLYKISLASLANVFQRGHRLRLTLHQINSTDSASASRTSRLGIGAQRARLTLQVTGGALQLQAAGPCTDCKPDAVAQEKLAPLFKRYITAGIKGTAMGIGLFASVDANGAASGKVAAYLPNGNANGAAVLTVEESSDPSYDYRLGLAGGYILDLRCDQDQDHGAFSLQVGSVTYTPEVIAGSVRCYDVPYANW